MRLTPQPLLGSKTRAFWFSQVGELVLLSVVDKAGDAVKHPTMGRKTPAAHYSAQRVTSTKLDAERSKSSLDCISSVEWREGSQHVYSNGKLLGSH